MRLGVGERLGERRAGEHHLRAERLGAGDLRERRVRGHHDRRRDAEQPRVVRDALRVVAGRRRDHAVRPLLGVEPEQEVARAPLLERRGVLEVLELQRELGAGDVGERAGLRARCLDDAPRSRSAAAATSAAVTAEASRPRVSRESGGTYDQRSRSA